MGVLLWLSLAFTNPRDPIDDPQAAVAEPIIVPDWRPKPPLANPRVVGPYWISRYVSPEVFPLFTRIAFVYAVAPSTKHANAVAINTAKFLWSYQQQREANEIRRAFRSVFYFGLLAGS